MSEKGEGAGQVVGVLAPPYDIELPAEVWAGLEGRENEKTRLTGEQKLILDTFFATRGLGEYDPAQWNVSGGHVRSKPKASEPIPLNRASRRHQPRAK